MAHELAQHVQIEISEEIDRATGALREVKDFPVVSPEDIAFAETLVLDAKKQWKRIDDRRKAITAPLNEALRSANDLFRPALGAYAEAEGTLRQKILAARAEIDRVNREAMLAAEAALAKNDVRGAALAAAPITAPPSTKGMTYRDVWEFRVVDAAISPREFLEVDEKKVKAWVAVHGDKNVIPGIVVTKAERATARPGGT